MRRLRIAPIVEGHGEEASLRMLLQRVGIAGADSLGDYLDLSQDRELPRDPEARRLGKAWIQHRFRKKPRYSPTAYQPAMTSHMNLRLARERSPSFAKLCRELEKRLNRD